MNLQVQQLKSRLEERIAQQKAEVEDFTTHARTQITHRSINSGITSNHSFGLRPLNWIPSRFQEEIQEKVGDRESNPKR